MQGIASALIIPTERPPSLREVKRALLTYDQVHILDPNDREIIPPESFGWVGLLVAWRQAGNVAELPPVALPSGKAVLPLGKAVGYDEAADRLLIDLGPAVSQASVRVRKAPTFANAGFTIPAGKPYMDLDPFSLPAGWPSPELVFLPFRKMAAELTFMRATLRGRGWASPGEDMAIATEGIGLDESAAFPLPVPASSLGDGAAGEKLRAIAGARLGSLAKSLGICQASGLHPFTTDAGHVAALELLEGNAREVAELCAEGADDRATEQLRRLESIVFREYVDPNVLDAMSVAEILKLRTKAWGRANEKRRQTFAAIRALALETATVAEFDAHVKREIDAYRRVRSDLDVEWGNTRFRASCDVIVGVAAVTSSGLAEKLLSFSSIEVLLTFGLIAIAEARKIVPEIRTSLHNQAALESDVGYALLGPHRFLAR